MSRLMTSGVVPMLTSGIRLRIRTTRRVLPCGIRSPNEVNTRHQGRQIICVTFIDPLLRNARQLLIEKH